MVKYHPPRRSQGRRVGAFLRRRIVNLAAFVAIAVLGIVLISTGNLEQLLLAAFTIGTTWYLQAVVRGPDRDRPHMRAGSLPGAVG